ncbi:MAG TPA: chromate transporter [Micropepsaceae bacterium]|nr:chromate transporter [Micropepsaceae bacterium]
MESSAAKPQIPLSALMAVFFRVGITSFGGSTAAFLYREAVERRRWMDDHGFVTALALCQVLPGANPVNLAIYLGAQLRGGIGGTVAAIGLIFPPFCLILLLAVLYAQYGNLPLVHAILGGLAAVGIGMTLSVGAKLARTIRKPVPVAIAGSLFITVGILHWPMIPMVLLLAPLSIGVERLLWKAEPQ